MFQCISRTIFSSVHLRPMFIFTIQKPVHYFSFFMGYLYFPPPDPLLGPQSWPQICIYWPWTPICIYRPWHQICVYQPSPQICIYRPWPPICIYWLWPPICVYPKFVFTGSTRPEFVYTDLVSPVCIYFDLYAHRLLSWFTHNDAD